MVSVSLCVNSQWTLWLKPLTHSLNNKLLLLICLFDIFVNITIEYHGCS